MAGFFSKASSFLSSQANDQKAPSHGGTAGSNDEEHPHKAPASSGGGGYGDLLESAQSFMATSKPSAAGGGGKPDIKKEGDGVDKAPGSGGYGDLLASAQQMMGSAKLGSGESKNVADAPKTKLSSGENSSGDMYASAQVLMGALKASREGGEADMGAVAGATANLIGEGTRYGDVEKTAYGEYVQKAQTYLQDYEASHGKGTSHKLPSSTGDQESSLPVVSKPQTRAKFGGNDEENEEVGSNPTLKTPMARSSEEDYN